MWSGWRTPDVKLRALDAKSASRFALRVLEKLHLRLDEVYRQCGEPAAASQEA